MKSKKYNKVLPLCVSVSVLSVIVGFTILAWTEPTVAPTGGNVSAPLNTGSVAQTKSGNLNIGSGLKYWLTKVGDSFALKNNAGAIKFIIGQDGNVGIGTTNPSQKLDVAGYVKGQTGLCIGSDCRTSWPDGISASSCPDPANQWVVGIGSDGKVICQTNAGGPPGVTSPCSKSLVGNNKRIFVTSTTYTGYQVSNVSKADAICQTHANAGKMSGVFKALMYYGDGTKRNPTDVLKAGNSFWNCGKINATTYDWKPVTNSPSAFFTADGAGNYLENPIQYNEVGNYTPVTVWTNFEPNGIGGWKGIGGYTGGYTGCTGVCWARASWGWAETWRGDSASKSKTWAYTRIESEEGGTYCNWYHCGCCMDDSRALYCVEQ